MQMVGHVITRDGETGGVVEQVGSAQVAQPDLLTVDSGTGTEIGRTPQAPLTVQSVQVRWEDGTTSELVEVVDAWSVIGNVVDFPRGADGPSADEQTKIDAALADVAGFMAEVRGASSYAVAAQEADAAPSHVLEDPTFAVTVVSTQKAETPTPDATLNPPTG